MNLVLAKLCVQRNIRLWWTEINRPQIIIETTCSVNAGLDFISVLCLLDHFTMACGFLFKITAELSFLY